jgi:hypothetical protein
MRTRLIRCLAAISGILWMCYVLYRYLSTDAHQLRLGHYFSGFFSQFGTYAGWNISYLRDFAFLALTLLIAASIGSTILSWIGAKELKGIERACFSMPIGLFVLGMATFALGMIGGLYQAIFYLLYALGIICYAPRWIRNISMRIGCNVGPGDRVAWFLLVLLGILLVVGVLYTLTPPTQSDGLSYHLAAPQEYLKMHRIQYLELNARSNFPFLIEMLFMLGMIMSGDILAKLFHFSMLCLTGLLLACFWKRFLEQPDGAANGPEIKFQRLDFHTLLVPAIFVTTPAAFILSCWSFVDLGVTLYFVGLIYSLCLWARFRSTPYLILCGIMGGAALGTKYTMLAFVILGTVLIALTPCKDGQPRRAGWKEGLAALAIALLLGSPWYIKNAAYTGNPVYPLAYGLFDGKDWTEANAHFYAAKMAEKGFGTTIPDLLRSPWDAAFYWLKFEAFNPGVLYLLFLPLAVVLLPVACVRAPEHTRATLLYLIIFALVYYLVWFFTYQSNRFLLPFFALLSPLIVFIIKEIRAGSALLAQIVLSVVLIVLAYNTLWNIRWITTEATPRPLPVVLGFESRDDYLTRALSYYRCFQYLNVAVAPDETVLFVGEHRSYYCTASFMSSDWFDTPYILKLIRETRDNHELIQWMRAHNVRYVFFNLAELNLYEERYFKPRFKPEEYQRFREFIAAKEFRRTFSPLRDMYVAYLSRSDDTP